MNELMKLASYVSGCDIRCDTEFNPVCGSDNETYANECVMRAESCLLRKIITVLHEGECREMKGNLCMCMS